MCSLFHSFTNTQEPLRPSRITYLIFQARATSSHPPSMVLMGAAMWETAQNKVEKRQPDVTAGGGDVTLGEPALGTLFFPGVIPLPFESGLWSRKGRN